MVGQKIIREGILDVKSPASGFARGWRPPPWKTRHVKLVEGESGEIELLLYEVSTDNLVDTYELHDISDVTMVTSKTHLHAFSIVSGTATVVVLSGDTELESRDWIWGLRKVFWPRALVETDSHDQVRVHLLSSPDVQNVSLRAGIYDFRVKVTAITISFISKYESRDPRSTPVEPFNDKDSRKTASFPLTAIGRFKLETRDGRKRLVMETSHDSEYGVCSFVFEAEGENDNGIKDVMDIVKNTLFRATNNLHDCIAASKWTFDTET